MVAYAPDVICSWYSCLVGVQTPYSLVLCRRYKVSRPQFDVVVQLVAVIPPVAVLELGGGPHSPWMSQDKREVLAEILAHALRLKVKYFIILEPDVIPAFC